MGKKCRLSNMKYLTLSVQNKSLGSFSWGPRDVEANVANTQKVVAKNLNLN